MTTKRVTKMNATNAQVLDAIRTDASMAYQERVPAATQGGIESTINALWGYTPMMNEFIDALVNRVGDVVIKSKIWDNPLARFKRGMMQYGDTIEEIGLDLIQAHRYDPNDCMDDVFECNPPNVMSNFHVIDRQDYYPLTINDTLLRRAFLSDYGLQEMVSRVLETPYTSDYWDEYLIMKRLFVEYEKADGFYKVNVPDAAAETTREGKQDAAMAITEAVRSIAGKMRFISRSYNAAGLPVATKPTELVLFATPDFTAMLDVNVLAFAFNVSAAELNVSVVEVDDFGIDGCQAILVDEDFFMCADTLINFESIRNPKAMSWNYWLHHWGVYSVSRFVNACMFSTEAGTSASVPTIAVNSVEIDYATVDGVKPTFAQAGGSTRFVATVDGTITPQTDGYSVPQGVVWSIIASDKPLNMRTFIDAEGVLHVWEREEATNLTIQAATTYVSPSSPISGQTAKTDTLVVGIGEAYVPPTPSASSTPSGETE